MGDHDPSAVPDGLSIEAVDWLPSGGRSGLVRVRGRWEGGPEEIPLPELVVERAGAVDRHASLPDPRAGRDRGAWRGAYVVHADLVEPDDARLILEFPGGVRVPLPRPSMTPAPASGAGIEGPGGELVDRAVLADRRARRAEAAEQAQARIAREAMKAVEVLELRAARLEEHLDALRGERDAFATRAREAELRQVAEPDPSPDSQELTAAEHRAERLREALIAAVGAAGDLRLQLHEARLRGRTAEIAHAADSVRVSVLASERSAVAAEVHTLRGGLWEAETLLAEQATEIEQAQARLAEVQAAQAEMRRDLGLRAADLAESREQIGRLEADLAASRAEAHRIATEELPAAVRAALTGQAEELAARHMESERVFAEREAEARTALEAARVELARAEVATRTEIERAEAAARAAIERAEAARQVAESAAAGANARARAADVARASLAAQVARLGGEEDPEAASELDAVRVQLDEARELIGAQAAVASSLADELERAWAEAEAARADAERAATAESARAEMSATIASLRTELAAAATRSGDDVAVVAALTMELDVMRERAKADRAAVAGLTEALDTARASVRTLAAEVDELRRRSDSLAAELEAERGRRSQPAPPPVPPALVASAAVQEAVAAAAAARPERERMVADLAAAAEALRARTPHPDPAGPTIVTAGDAPRAVATGRDAREYPALRGALVKLAHDDPTAAARLLAGLLPAQWRLIDKPVDYDLTIAELGTFACTVTAGSAVVRALAAPRARSEAEFHLRTDALTLAEMLAGVGPRPRRFGRAKVSGRARRAKALQGIPGSTMSMPDAIRAGAQLEPELVLRTLAYAVHPSWTKDHEFTIAQTFTGPEGDETLYITAAGSFGLRVSAVPPAESPRATVVITRSAFAAMLRGEAPAPGERPSTRGDHRAAQTLRGWADRARAG